MAISKNKLFYIYVLQSQKDLRTYTGYTENVDRRLKEHNAGKVKATQYRTPFKLLFTEQFPSKKEAKQRELWWKSSIGRKKLKELFEEMFWKEPISK